MQELYLYNTMTQSKQLFTPKGQIVKIYACGVTVYDRCHIGHGRSLFVFSLLKRLLEHLGYTVKFVRNITDIDDKIIERIWQRNNYKQISLEELKDFVEDFISAYYQDLHRLGLPEADIEPRATEYIEKMIAFVEKLIKLGYAYVTEKGNVYYSVRNFDQYGKLSHRNIEELLSGVRKDVEGDKRFALDFVLWKRKKDKEPYWESPWGPGRPGWHLECAVMSTDLLGGGFDIHGGGRDLIFPHHENEIAEAEPLLGGEFARYWVHHGMVTVNGEKMSKSLGNFITLKDALDRYPSALWKLWYLTSHYRSPIDFSEKKMSEIEKMYEKICLWFSLLKSNKNKEDEFLDSLGEKFYELVLSALCDDLNTPKALAVLFSTIGESLERLKEGKGSKQLFDKTREIFYLLFIEPRNEIIPVGLDEELISLIVRAREILRKHKEYEISDRIRELLRERGIVIEDTPFGSRWLRK